MSRYTTKKTIADLYGEHLHANERLKQRCSGPKALLEKNIQKLGPLALAQRCSVSEVVSMSVSDAKEGLRTS